MVLLNDYWSFHIIPRAAPKHFLAISGHIKGKNKEVLTFGLNPKTPMQRLDALEVAFQIEDVNSVGGGCFGPGDKSENLVEVH